jgi:hypothetical protein
MSGNMSGKTSGKTPGMTPPGLILTGETGMMISAAPHNIPESGKMRYRWKNAARGAFLLLPAVTCIPFPLPAQTPWARPERAVVAWDTGATGEDSLDQLSLEAVFVSMGFRTERVRPAQCEMAARDSHNVLVLPHAAAAHMTQGESRKFLAAFERGGGVLVTDGVSPLARMLGVVPGSPVHVEEIADHLRPEVRVRWPGDQVVPWIAGFPKASANVVYSDKARNHPLAVIMTRKRGRCLYIGPLVDPFTGRGYFRFATLPWVIAEGMRCRPALSRRAADAYFDPGYRAGVPAESLARMWRSWGIRGVHAAAWYASGSPPYDYSGLVEALHRNGLLAYAWLEWPYVGKAFWDRHPLWRQKNALLQDAHLDFLYLMDLQNPECMAEALKELKLLLALDWDGVDVAEFTLTGAGREALEGPAMPEFFTGFTDFGRHEFLKQAGFDPTELFDPRSGHYWKADTSALKTFYRYRTGVNYAAERTIYGKLRKADREKGRSGELMLTIVDNALHPEFDDLLGFNMNETVAIAKQFGLTLNIEDPYTEWSRPPGRYTAMGKYYRRLLGERPFMIDVNVVPLEEDRKGRFSTEQPAGTEFLQLWRYASGETDRVCFYSESSVYEKDWQLLPFAMAGRGSVKGEQGAIRVDGPTTVTLRCEPGEWKVQMDGQPWPARGDSEITVPAGKHRIRLSQEKGVEGIRLLSITGELYGARWSGDSLAVDYQSVGRCLLGFDTVPERMTIDEKPALLRLYRAGDGCVVIAPPGTHRCAVSRR